MIVYALLLCSLSLLIINIITIISSSSSDTNPSRIRDDVRYMPYINYSI